MDAMIRKIFPLPLGAMIALCGLAALPSTQSTQAAGVEIETVDDQLRITIDSEHFADYHYQDVSRPFLFPVIGPDGLQVTRNWPIRPGEDEQEDHPHHRSLWYAHGDINGVDFWSESPTAGTTEHVEFVEVSSGADQGTISSRNRLVSKDGKVIATDLRTIQIHNRKHDRLIDFEITVIASEGPLTFGDTKEGSMAIRLAETMRLSHNKFNKGKQTGHIVNSAGQNDNNTWGKRASWVDYYGPVDGKTVGVAIFDHPDNPRHPTWWHVRNYGLFAANPFGVHDFEKMPPGTGDLEVPEGEAVTWRYRFYIHRGDTKQAKVAKQYREYAGTDGYQLLYQQDFPNDSALQGFAMTDPNAWRITQTDQGGVLELVQQSKYQPPVRSPVNIAMISERAFGDFILECDLMQTGREYGHRDMCLFFGIQSPSQFYYTHIATAADDHAHNIFVVKDAPRTKIAKETTKGVDWGLNVWHHVRLERRNGVIKVYFDDLTKPIMKAEDKTFGAGFIGFGSFDDTGMIKNIRIWGPEAEKREASFFKRL